MSNGSVNETYQIGEIVVDDWESALEHAQELVEVVPIAIKRFVDGKYISTFYYTKEK